MPSQRFVLADPPADNAGLAWWMEHGAGFILLNDVRDYALAALPDDMTDREQEIALLAANRALYGLMMVADGVSGGIWNDRHRLSVKVAVELTDVASGESRHVALEHSEGVCGWYHQWIEGDFGSTPIVDQKGAG